jgi:hypothetical protein
MAAAIRQHADVTEAAQALCCWTNLFSVLLLPWMGQPEVNFMKNFIQIMAGAVVVTLLNVAAFPALSQTATTNLSTAAANKYHGAPGPIAGAGLPVVAVGFGVYWLVKRRRRKAE